MPSTVTQRSIVIASLASTMLLPAMELAAQSQTEAKVVAQLYKDHAWQAFSTQSELFGKYLGDENKVALEKYFAPDLASLLVEDTACAIRTNGMCNLDFDILFDAQDPRITDLEVTRLSAGKVRVQFKDPVTDDTSKIEFKLVIIGGKWRISDVIYLGHPDRSLKAVLSRPLPKS